MVGLAEFSKSGGGKAGTASETNQTHKGIDTVFQLGFMKIRIGKRYPRKVNIVGIKIAAIMPTIAKTIDTSTRIPTNFQNDFW